MKKKIFCSVMLAVMTVLVVDIAVTTGFLYNYFSKAQIEQLRSQLHYTATIMNAYEGNYIKVLDNSTYRFTLIASDGTVLHDTKINSAEMDNHLDREEIEEALATGEGGSTRYSSTLTEKTIYASLKLDNGAILRASISQKTVISLGLSMLPYIIGIALLAAVISFVLAKRTAKNITEPLSRLDLNNPAENNTYDELVPILSKLNKQHKQIKSQRDALQQKQDEFEQIVSSMNEGLVLLDEHGIILSMNTAAKKMFVADETIIGKNFLTVDRTPEINKVVNDALAGHHRELRIQRNGCEYQLNISSIVSETKKLGTVILAFDITDKAFAERNRREFTTNITHELKTPLQSIIGSAELLETGLAKPEDINKFIGNIHKEATHLANLINDIIHLSQLDENTEPATETVDLSEVVNEVADVLSDSADKKGVSLLIDCEPLCIKGVRRYIYEIIYNLCDNAIRYNIDGGKVIVRIYNDKANTVIEVSDTGIGISPEHHARIFERFYRVDKSHSKKTGGTGLGLSIVKHAVQFHSGKLELESKLGKGTTIKVIL
ncbi:MAG: PAS domain S-box protein [Clostridiales bacterium]|nr:PAS domain S-box protein [Clostridiales bacterium]